MANRQIKLAALYNVDSNIVRVQVYIIDDCDDFFHPEDVLSGCVQLFNVYNLPETGLQEVPLEKVSVSKEFANQDGFFNIFEILLRFRPLKLSLQFAPGGHFLLERRFLILERIAKNLLLP